MRKFATRSRRESASVSSAAKPVSRSARWYTKYSSNWSRTTSTGPPSRLLHPSSTSASEPSGGSAASSGAVAFTASSTACSSPQPRVVGPAPVDGDGELGQPVLLDVLAGGLPQPVQDSGLENGALADAARAVQDRNAVGEQVVRDVRAPVVAPEEVVRVVDRIRHEAEERRAARLLGGRLRRGRSRGHGRFRRIASTQASRSDVTILTPSRLQNFSSISSTSCCTAHEFRGGAAPPRCA